MNEKLSRFWLVCRSCIRCGAKGIIIGSIISCILSFALGVMLNDVGQTVIFALPLGVSIGLICGAAVGILSTCD